MRKFSWFGAFTLVLGACAPARPVSAPPAARPAPAQTAPAPAAPEPDEALASASRAWWLLDESADRVRGISAERTYRELLAGKQPRRTVVVAIIDSGVDIEHEDLNDNIWKNPREVPGNQQDDDRNGYVDDVHGWNFIGGKDGKNVEQDTYELTRLYARLRPRCEGAGTGPRAECAQYPQIKADFERRRANAEQQLAQTRQISTIINGAIATLKQQAGTDSLTPARVAAIPSSSAQVQQAKQIYQQLLGSGMPAAEINNVSEQLASDMEQVEKSVKFHFNPDFDPRPIVGDNYANPAERFYGNPDVEGPDAGHGTHVAGIVAAERGNSIGVDGIAPAVRIMSVRAVPDGDERDKDVANAIRYAVDNGANIINMSFGKGYSPEKRLVDDAVRYADSRGVLMVHAAGNESADIDTSPNFPTRIYEGGGSPRNWIEVGASGQGMADTVAAVFSNYGRTKVDVFAPGVGILSTVPGNEYETNSGTSMAAPVVSGLAALLMAYYPQFSAEQVRQIILDSATRYPTQSVLRPGQGRGRVPFGELSATGGIVNAYAAIRLAEQRAAGAAAPSGR